MHTSPLLTKYAASRWRSLVRSGELSGKSLSELKGMGLLHTPDAMKREVAGLNRGSENIMKRYGITSSTSNVDPSTAMRVPGHPTSVKGLALGLNTVRGQYIGTMGGTKVQKYRWRRAERQLQEAESVQAKDVTEHIHRATRTNASPLTIRFATTAQRPHNRALRALIDRHEVNEALLSRGSRQNLPAGMTARAWDTQVLRPMLWSTHLSPRVIMHEAGHANFLPTSVFRRMEHARTQLGEAAAFNTVAGKPLPYAQWSLRDKKQARVLEKAVRKVAPEPPK